MDNKGITLIELVVVMAIMGIGALLIAPSIGSWVPHYRLNSGTRDVVYAMRIAQMKAVSRNISYRVSFSAAGNSYVLQFEQSPNNWVTEGNIINLPKNITFINASFSSATPYYANFSPDSTSSSGNVILSNPKGNRKKINLSTYGSIRLE